MYINYVVMIIFFMFSTASFSAVAPKDFPKDLIYNNAPISPTCFGMNQDSDIISLDKCSPAASADIKIVGASEDLIKKGYVGFDYKTIDDSGSVSQISGYSYYKVIGHFNHAYTLYTLNNGGGTGEFSSIYSVNRKANHLTVKGLVPGGDRCNGGIHDVKQNDHVLTYSVNITPADFLEITKQNPHHLRAYDDLDACAICCAAIAVYETNLNEPNKNAKLMSVTFTSDSQNVNENKPRQACFDKIIKRYQDSGKTSLTEAELMKFMGVFNSECA